MKSIRISKEGFRDFGTLTKLTWYVGTLGSVTRNFEKYVDKIGIKIDLHTEQKPTFLSTARKLRKVLEW